MKPYNVYYLPYIPEAKVNYLYILYLYGLAERGISSQVKSLVRYQSVRDLCEQINNKFAETDDEKQLISISTMNRVLNSKVYQQFFSIGSDAKSKYLLLNNDFYQQKECCFVRLIPSIYKRIVKSKDNLFAKYLIYLVYKCSIHKNKTDFTANQFLDAFGLSTHSNDNKSRISGFNTLLEQESFVLINRWRDAAGNNRNTYSLIDDYYTPQNKKKTV